MRLLKRVQEQRFLNLIKIRNSTPENIFMSTELTMDDPRVEGNVRTDVDEPLPFPFNQRSFCRYEPIEKRVAEARVLVVDDLLRDERDVSDVARRELGRSLQAHLNRERQIATLAVENIVNNINRLVQNKSSSY